MDFLAFLVLKLWPKCHELIRKIPANPLGDSGNNWNSVDLGTLESRSRTLKTHVIA